MELAWNWAAVPGIVGGLLCWTLAALVYSAAPARAQNRWLAALLAVEGGTLVTAYGLLYTATDPTTALGIQHVGTAGQILTPFLYLGFLGTLDVPGVRILRTRAAVALLLVGAAAASFHRAAFPTAWIRSVGPVSYAPYEAELAPLAAQFNLAGAAGAVVGLAVALVALRRAPGPVARRRASLYALAFGIRDGWGLVTATYFVATGGAFGIVTTTDYLVYILGAQVSEILFATALAYAILSAQLFEIDVKLRWTVSRGTVAAAFVAVFFVVTQVAHGFLSDTYGVLAGGAAAGLMLFALAPLQRAAERVAVAAVPAPAVPVAADDRLALYRDHVRAAWEDGALDRSERRLLDHLRARLGVSADDAMRIEGEVAAG